RSASIAFHQAGSRPTIRPPSLFRITRGARPCAAWRKPTTSRDRWCSSRRTRPVTSPARTSPSMAAGRRFREERMRRERSGWLALATMLLATLSAMAQQPFFELGTVARSEPQQYVVNAYPVVDRLGSGRLVCIFSVATAQKPMKLKIAVSVSDDNGKTWSNPQIVFDHTNAEDADPNLLVDGDRVLAFSTSVPYPAQIAKSLIFMRESHDGVNWGPETLLVMPHKYIAGKIHQGHRLADGTLIVGYAWDTWAEQNMP